MSICRLNLLVLLATGLLSITHTASAQTDGGSDEVEEIVVTGSRLKRGDLSAPSPTVILSEEDVRLSGRGTLEGILNELPQFNADGTASTADTSGAGLHTADLRSLRPERTLVLVNGKRFAPANETGLVDLSRVPDALIDRVEVITGGASAVYGSDAIAGAVNFIIRNDFEGLDVRYDYGTSTKNDAETNKISLTFGTNFADDRGNVTASVEWYDQKPALFDDRSFSEFAFDVRDGELVRAGSSNIPGTRFSLSETEISQLVGVDLTDFTTDRDFSNGGTGSCTRVSGIRFGRNGVPLPFCDPEDRFNTNPTNYLLRPYERYSLSALAHFEISEGVEAYTESFFSNNRNTWNLNSESFRPRTSGQTSLVLPDYVNNPVLFPATRAFIAANAGIFDPDGDGNAEFFAGGRRLNEAGSRFFNYDNTSFSITGGLRGEFDFRNGPWAWDTFYQVHRATEAQNVTQRVSDIRLSLAVDVVVDPVTGEARCRNEFVGCVPANFLGIDSLTPEMVEFLTPDIGDDKKFDRRILHGSITGELFELPAGPVAAAFGFEWREDEYQFIPGGLNQEGVDGSVPPAVNASSDVSEVFTEFRIPLVADRTGIDLLAVELAYRYSDYSNSGGNDTYKYSIEYAPVDWLRFRGAYNRAVRAPSLNDLFSPQIAIFEGGVDPCDSQLNPSQEVKDLCVLTGVPAGDIDTFVPTVELTARRGGNPDLDVEKSDTVTAGFVMSPPFIEGLNLTLDWYEIEVEDAITAVQGETIAQACYSGLDINSPFCRAITRLPNGLIFEVLATSSNIASLKSSGWDLSFDYRNDLPDAFGIGTNGAEISLIGWAGLQDERTIQQISTAPGIDCAGLMGRNCSGFNNRPVPDQQFKISLNYHSGQLTLGTTARMIGEFGFVADDVRGEAFGNKISAETYWDFSANYYFTDNFQINAVLKNAFDNEPTLVGQEIAGDAGVDVGLYDVIGQRVTVGLRYVFD